MIAIDDARRYQPILGVGATVTNSAAWLLEGLSSAARSKVIVNLFGSHHAHIGVVRISIGGSDFNAGGLRYSEDDLPPGQRDPGLRHFGLGHDRNTIAVLREALRDNPGLRIVASPWSAPAWMKSNDSLQNVGYRGYLRRRYYATYAQYFVKFIRGYQRAGVPIWAITVQNEPGAVPATYEGMSFPAPDAARFIRDYLRPALRRAHLHTAILGHDKSWHAASYAREEQRLAGGLDGIAWHCYDGNADAVMPTFPNRTQIVSECANNLIRSPASAVFTNMFNDGAQATVLWTAASDPSGGPVVAPNQTCGGCHGVVIIDPVHQTVSYVAEYDQLRQFGHALTRGARRIFATRLGTFEPGLDTDRASLTLHDVAFRNPDGTDVAVVFNNTAKTGSFTLSWRHRVYTARIPAQWTMTLTWKGAGHR